MTREEKIAQTKSRITPALNEGKTTVTKPNMKPYDPSHKGEFCTRDGCPVRIFATDRKSVSGNYPIIGASLRNGNELVRMWTKEGYENAQLTNGDNETDLMCVIPNREARAIEFDSDGTLISLLPNEGFQDVTFREVLPGDIRQEYARAVVEAAKFVVRQWKDGAKYTGIADLYKTLRLRP